MRYQSGYNQSVKIYINPPEIAAMVLSGWNLQARKAISHNLSPVYFQLRSMYYTTQRVRQHRMKRIIWIPEKDRNGEDTDYK